MVCGVFAFCAATAIASPAQILTTLHSFAGYPSEGSLPLAGLVQGADGNFYGTTTDGGASPNCPGYPGCGTVFKITPSGTLTTLYSFSGGDGVSPAAALIQATDGNFYGTTEYGGSGCNGDGCGTIFKITPDGLLTTLHKFCSENGCADGYAPSGLMQATNGNFYGTTGYGGANDSCQDGCGTVFRITPSGTLTTVHNFCSQPNCADGSNPSSGLLQASDGNFYGETGGTVFKMTPSGFVTTLCSFNGSDGTYPAGGLVQANDGNFYGTTEYGGANGIGTVFAMTPEGTLTTLHSFDYSDGLYPGSGVVQATDGNFYGTTPLGGGGSCGGGCGTVFEVSHTGEFGTLYGFGGPDGGHPYAGLLQARDGNFYGTTFEGGANGDGTVFRLVTVRACTVCPSL